MRSTRRILAAAAAAATGCLWPAAGLLAHPGHGAPLAAHLHPWEAALLAAGLLFAAAAGWRWLRARGD